MCVNYEMLNSRLGSISAVHFGLSNLLPSFDLQIQTNAYKHTHTLS
jgi:hypothetical protein